MAGYPPDPYGGALSLGFGGQESLEPFAAGTILEPLEGPPGDLDDSGYAGKRRHPRQAAPPCRPVTVRVDPDGLAAAGVPSGRWFYADILDISSGGLCLLITDTQDLEVGLPVAVDFKSHRLPAAFAGETQVTATLRWFVRSGPVTTMGLGFLEPLPALPELLPERRHRLRDPNLPPDGLRRSAQSSR